MFGECEFTISNSEAESVCFELLKNAERSCRKQKADVNTDKTVQALKLAICALEVQAMCDLYCP